LTLDGLRLEIDRSAANLAGTDRHPMRWFLEERDPATGRETERSKDMTPPVIKEQRAKQGREGKPVLVIMLVSLSLLAVAAIVYLFWVGATSPTVQEQEAPPQDVPITSPASPGNPVPTAPPGQPGQAQ
jgi:hypothetical protein